MREEKTISSPTDLGYASQESLTLSDDVTSNNFDSRSESSTEEEYNGFSSEDESDYIKDSKNDKDLEDVCERLKNVNFTPRAPMRNIDKSRDTLRNNAKPYTSSQLMLQSGGGIISPPSIYFNNFPNIGQQYPNIPELNITSPENTVRAELTHFVPPADETSSDSVLSYNECYQNILADFHNGEELKEIPEEYIEEFVKYTQEGPKLNTDVSENFTQPELPSFESIESSFFNVPSTLSVSEEGQNVWSKSQLSVQSQLSVVASSSFSAPREHRNSFSTSSTPSHTDSIEYSPRAGSIDYSPLSNISAEDQNSSSYLSNSPDLGGHFLPNISEPAPGLIPVTVNGEEEAENVREPSAKDQLTAILEVDPCYKEKKRKAWKEAGEKDVGQLVLDIRQLAQSTTETDKKSLLKLYASAAFLKIHMEHQTYETLIDPIHTFLLRRQVLIAKYLIEIVAEKNTDLSQAPDLHKLLHKIVGQPDFSEEDLDTLLKIKTKSGVAVFDVNYVDENGFAPLHLALSNCNSHSSQAAAAKKHLLIVLNHGANLLIKTVADGSSILQYAVIWRCDLDVLDTLIKEAERKGQKLELLNSQNNKGNTVLHLAYARKTNSNHEKDSLINLLITHGADQLTNYSGMLPSEMAN